MIQTLFVFLLFTFTTPSPDAPSTRARTVTKIQTLQFEGDAAALGAYVDAIIDNNYEDDNTNPQLLRLSTCS